MVALVGLIVIGGCSLLPLDALIFHPDRSMPDPPPGIEERWITTADGVRLHAWWVGDTTRPTVVWSHGNGGNIACRGDVLLGLAARGLSVLAYDYRGYGRSGGRPTEGGVYQDAEAAYESVRAAGVPAGHIVAFGESLGGAVAIRLATVRPCAGVGVVCTFTTLRDVARTHFGPIAFLAGERFDSLARVRTLGIPLFVAHGDRDETVPFVLGERLFAAAREPKRFLRAAGRHHNDVFDAPGLLDAIATFAREVTASPHDSGT